MAENPISSQEIANREHIAPKKTGDNIAAKKVASYSFNGTEWARQPLPFLTKPFDEILITYTDSSKATISTIKTKLAGTIQETITYTSGATTDDFARS